MADRKSIFDELKNPADWAAFIFGAAAGAIASGHLSGLDLGHSIPTGGLAAVAAERALLASLRRPILSRKWKPYSEYLERQSKAGNLQERLLDLQQLLQLYHSQWKSRLISNDDFERYLSEIADEILKRQKAAIELKFPPPGTAKKSTSAEERRDADSQ